jgi:hypothetical protein
MNGFKPNAKMSSTCHYSHGGAVMKKAKGGAVAKKATGGAMRQAYQTQVRRNPRDNGVALGPDDRPLGMPKPKVGGVMGSPVKPKGGMMGNGPFGPRNPNGPRKPMPGMSVAGPVLSSMFKGPMARKKGGMAKGMK